VRLQRDDSLHHPPLSGGVHLALAAKHKSNGVFVDTFDTSGTPADTGFYLSVNC
jgi:hypothetical protein